MNSKDNPKSVPGMGPLNPKIAIVGEAPGVEEVSKGIPFVGSSGKLLNSMLANVSIDRREVYVTNVCKIRPSNNNFGEFYADKSRRVESEFLLESQRALILELKARNPNIIIALGAESLRSLTGKRGIDKWRGSLLKSPAGKLIATFHPAYIMRMYHHRAIAEFDLRRAREESFNPELTLSTHNFQLDPSFDLIIKTLTKLKKTKVPISFDIETMGSHIRCLGIAWNSLNAISIPFISRKGAPRQGSSMLFIGNQDTQWQNHWPNANEERDILLLLNDLLSDKFIPKIAQNFKFDAEFIAREFNIHVQGLRMDTMVAHHTIYSELPKSLDFLASIYTRVPHYSNHDPSIDIQEWVYNCLDCCVTFEVYTKLTEELKTHNLHEYYRNMAEAPMVMLSRCGSRGILIDQEELSANRLHHKTRIAETLNKIHSILGKDFNPKSTKQLKDLFYGTYKISPILHPKTGALTLNEEALSKIARDKPEHTPLIKHILNLRQSDKLLSTFLDPTKLNDAGRMETSFNITGTVTGRISSSSTILGKGGNLQQIPRGNIRRMFKADRGNTWIKVDLSQAEVRVVAWLANIPRLIERFSNDPSFDIHRWNATNIYGNKEEEVTRDQRNTAKAGVHGGNYGLGARKASSIFGLPYEDAKRSIESYRRALPQVQEWWAKIDKEITDTRSLTTPLGRRRVFLGRIDNETFRSGYSFIPQSVVCDVINRAIVVLESVLQAEGAYPILQVHDEIDFLCPTDNVPTAIQKIRNVLEYPIDIEGIVAPLIIPCDIAIGANWHDVTEIAS